MYFDHSFPINMLQNTAYVFFYFVLTYTSTYLLSRYQMFKQYISLASILRPRNSIITTSKLYVVDKARLKKVASL